MYRSIPKYAERGYLKQDDVFQLVRPLVDKAADLGQYVPNKMPSLFLDDLGETPEQGATVLKRFRRNLPYFLSSPASMEDMFARLDSHTRGQTLGELMEVKADASNEVSKIIKYVAGEAPPVEQDNLGQVANTLYSKEQAGVIKKKLAENRQK